ncbi:MAG: Stealth CR1 domain-containing protein [Alistipes sp.]|nr:Stealth CR1 domain-containing protein [Alistipes sp.]
MSYDIDIVIPWVDGADPEWRAAFRAARDGTANVPVVVTGADENSSDIRYRDWDTLRWWFRGVERFAPWVRRIHFVTWGHVPEWLDLQNPRLRVVRHGDYIPAEYLPTFASRPIELCAHLIPGLAERFILFNDDMFFTRPVAEGRFFCAKSGLPRDMARLSLIARSTISHTVLNMTEVLNRRHSRAEVMRSHAAKWYSPRYGAGNLLKTLDLSVWRQFAGLADTHMPQPYLRSTFERMWVEEFAILDATCRERFRSPFGVNHWLMRYEQLARGEFSPVGFRDARLDHLAEDRIGEVERYIRARKYAMICLNDSPMLGDFVAVRDRLAKALDHILPQKSSYEI